MDGKADDINHSKLRNMSKRPETLIGRKWSRLKLRISNVWVSREATISRVCSYKNFNPLISQFASDVFGICFVVKGWFGIAYWAFDRRSQKKITSQISDSSWKWIEFNIFDCFRAVI
jgi:hypothetical protein